MIALSATQQYFSLSDVAQRVLPTLAPLAIDPEKQVDDYILHAKNRYRKQIRKKNQIQVRDQSFKAMNGFLEKLKKASDNPELIPELEAQVKAGGRGGLLSGDKV